MKILILKTGEIADCATPRALRLIEQGKAVPVKEPAIPAKGKTAKAAKAAKAAGEG